MIEMVMTRVTDEDTYKAVSFDIVTGGAVIGSAAVLVDGGGAYCERIDIDEQQRGRGFGTAALMELSRMYSGVTVAPDNADAARLYARIGTPSNADYYDQGHGVFEI